jgi:hypothetical protein
MSNGNPAPHHRGGRRGRRVRRLARARSPLTGDRPGQRRGREIRRQPGRRIHHARRARLGHGRRRCGNAGTGSRPGPRRRCFRRCPAEREDAHPGVTLQDAWPFCSQSVPCSTRAIYRTSRNRLGLEARAALRRSAFSQCSCRMLGVPLAGALGSSLSPHRPAVTVLPSPIA